MCALPLRLIEALLCDKLYLLKARSEFDCDSDFQDVCNFKITRDKTTVSFITNIDIPLMCHISYFSLGGLSLDQGTHRLPREDAETGCSSEQHNILLDTSAWKWRQDLRHCCNALFVCIRTLQLLLVVLSFYTIVLPWFIFRWHKEGLLVLSYTGDLHASYWTQFSAAITVSSIQRSCTSELHLQKHYRFSWCVMQ